MMTFLRPASPQSPQWPRPRRAIARVLLLLALVLAAGPIQLLTARPLAAQTTVPAPVPTGEAAAAKARLETIRTDLKQVESRLRDDEPTEFSMLAMRQRLAPLIEELRILVSDSEPRTDQARKRLEQLGAKPDAKATAESAEIATERSTREKAFAEADDAQRLTQDALAQAEGLQTEIGDKRRTLFARALFQRGPSLLSPELWSGAIQGLPSDWKGLRQLFGDWDFSIAHHISRGTGLPFLFALIAAVALYILRHRHLPQLVERAALKARSSRLSLLLLSLLHLAAGALPAILASWLLHAGLTASGMIPYRLNPFIWSILSGIAFVVFARTLADATLAPEHPERRIFGLADRNAVILKSLISSAALTIVLAKITEALLQAIAAGLALSIIVRGLFAILFALIVAYYLRQLRDTSNEEEQCLGPYVPVDGAVLAPFRIVGWVAIAVIVLSALTGYVAFASFLVDQDVWLVLIAVMLALSILLVDACAHHTLQDGGKVSQVLQSNIGLRQKSIAQFSLLGAGFAKLALYFTAGLLVLAPWGIESGDILSSLRAAFFGFKVGDVTVSLSSIVIGAAVFSLGLLATRTLQGWLEDKFLPETELDLGLRNSIKTAVGYVGFAAAIALAFSSLGFSLDKLTIVAGALSVGIGFGLQSIVSNFVSGLILLWERPIRVGDLIVVGDGEGVVRRINVRSTEIETFDRSTVIVPNSNLISGVVKNRVRSDRTGRVIISISVPRTTDAARIRDVLLDVAKANTDVLREPPPRVFFRKIGETVLDFDLICVVPEIDTAGRVSSDLHFEIFARLAKEGIGQPEREVSIKGLDRIEESLEDIADAIEEGQEMEAAGRAQAIKAAAPKKPKGTIL